MIQRQGGEDGFAFARELGFNPCARLLHVGDDVAVGQNSTLGHACGAASVLQEGHVFQRELNWRKGVVFALSQGIFE